PVGETPILKVKLTKDHLSSISALGIDGELLIEVQEKAYDSEDVVRFLENMLEAVEGKITIIWDNSPIHKSKKIKEFLKSGAAKRIHLEALPGYAPELNPTEGIWNWLKKVELKNRCFSDIESLKQGVIEASGRLIEREDVRLGCVAECKYITS
ncbi:transposase, partial [Athalassotoga sp.]|uniref:transposase n=1 Tax=Athalassotoga sp. TaxID=2022597 RepID=UPI003CFDDBF3